MLDLCLGVFECLIDYCELMRFFFFEAFIVIGDVYKLNVFLLVFLCLLYFVLMVKIKMGVLEFVLYVFFGCGGGVDEVVYMSASVFANLESWIDFVVELVCDVNELLVKVVGLNLGVIYVYVDGVVVLCWLLVSLEYK